MKIVIKIEQLSISGVLETWVSWMGSLVRGPARQRRRWSSMGRISEWTVLDVRLVVAFGTWSRALRSLRTRSVQLGLCTEAGHPTRSRGVVFTLRVGVTLLVLSLALASHLTRIPLTHAHPLYPLSLSVTQTKLARVSLFVSREFLSRAPTT